jgi:HK97 gp10 family phage protein
MRSGLTIGGLAEVKRAFRELEPKVARKVIRQAERRAAKLFQAEILAHVPVASGKLKRSVKVRASKGPRGFRKNISIAVLVGQGGGQQAKGLKTAWYAYLQEKGYHLGKRVRKAGKVTGYVPLPGRLGSGGVRYMPGRHFVKNALRTREPDARRKLILWIGAGIDREAASSAKGRP